MKKLIALFFLLCGMAHAVDSPDCQQTNVQNAITASASGVTIHVPSGSCSWSSAVSINSGKTLQGAGITQTHITVTAAGAGVNITGATSPNVTRVTGIDFVYAGPTTSAGIVEVGGTNFSVAFRFDHNHITIGNNGNTSRGIETSSVYGLIDNNTFDVTTTSSVQVISPSGTPINTDGGFTAWMQPLSLGTINAVYVEDNTFNYPLAGSAEDAIDGYSGSRIAVRFNQFNNAHIGFHGTDSGGNRGPVSLEIYNNTFTNNTAPGGGTTFRAATIRGGTGVMFNNIYNGTHGAWNGFTLQVFRACAAQVTSWGIADGTKWYLGDANVPPFSSNASRTVITSGAGSHVCTTNREIFCHADSACPSSGTCTKFFDGDGTLGYPVRDQPGIGPGQISAADPLYQWNNAGGVSFGTFDGGHPECDPAIANDIQSGRDYINGVARPGYVPFTYPHPLQGGGGSPAFFANTSLLTFGAALVGQTLGPNSIMISNTGTANLVISAVSNTGDFSFNLGTTSPSCGPTPITLIPGGTCLMTVSFTPTIVGSRTGQLSFTDNASGSPHLIGLSGTGQAPTTFIPTMVSSLTAIAH